MLVLFSMFGFLEEIYINVTYFIGGGGGVLPNCPNRQQTAAANFSICQGSLAEVLNLVSFENNIKGFPPWL